MENVLTFIYRVNGAIAQYYGFADTHSVQPDETIVSPPAYMLVKVDDLGEYCLIKYTDIALPCPPSDLTLLTFSSSSSLMTTGCARFEAAPPPGGVYLVLLFFTFHVREFPN